MCPLMTVALAAVACSTSSGSETPADGPNIVFVLLDDLDNTTSPFWDALPRTKILLADRGLTLTNNFATDPECCPARATLLTGNYPHNTGIFDATPPDGGFRLFAKGAEADTVSTRLRAAGYATAFVGKYLNGYEQVEDRQHVPPGWDEWFGLTGSFNDGFEYKANHNGKIESYGNDVDDYQTDVLAHEATEFVRQQESDDNRPFLLYLWPGAPHAPLGPAPRHQGNRFADDPLPVRPNYDEADVSDKPTWIRYGRAPLGPEGLERFTAQYRRRMGSMLAVDEMVEAVVDTLDAEGELDDTVILLSSDNGYNFGAHRLEYKQAPYEESTRVPLVVAGPGVRTGTDDRLVTHLDMVPTVLDLAGASAEDLDGRSLVPLLDGENPRWRGDFLIEFHGTYGTYALDIRPRINEALYFGNGVPYVPTYRALRNQQYLYVEWYAGDDHEYELYDVTTDPYELVNLLATPEGAAQYASMTGALHERLEELGACAGSRCRTNG